MLNVKTTGFINFNEDYNKVLSSGAITVSVAHSVKDKDGEFHNEYINGLIPAKLVKNIKPHINKTLVDIEGVIDLKPTEHGQVYANMTIFTAKPHKKQSHEEEIDLPF